MIILKLVKTTGIHMHVGLQAKEHIWIFRAVLQLGCNELKYNLEVFISKIMIIKLALNSISVPNTLLHDDGWGVELQPAYVHLALLM